MQLYLPDDVIYMRFLKAKKVLRVAKVDPSQGLVVALYPSRDRGFFYAEAFREPDDNTRKRRIRVSEIEDDVWKRLLAGEGIEAILKDYEPFGGTGDECDNKTSYYFAKRGTEFEGFRTPTFHICDDKDEEDILKKGRSKQPAAI